MYSASRLNKNHPICSQRSLRFTAENAAVPKVEAGLPNGSESTPPTVVPAAAAAAAPIKQEAVELPVVPGLQIDQVSFT